MAQMKSSWDEETQQHFLDQLIGAQFEDDGVQVCDRQPFPEVDRQPDLIFQDESGQATDYVYFLQPAEISETLFTGISQENLEHVRFYVPYSHVETTEDNLSERSVSPVVVPYRINCGQLQVMDG